MSIGLVKMDSRVSWLVNTSIDDCVKSLRNGYDKSEDLPILETALAVAQARKDTKTLQKHLSARIAKIKKTLPEQRESSYFDLMELAGGEPIIVTEELYDYALNVLPPVYGNKCFGMGEPFHHDSNNIPIYFFFSRINDTVYGLLGTKAQAETTFQKLRRRLCEVEEIHHCQNCNQYKHPTELKEYGALRSCCKRCRIKLEAAALAKSQRSFTFVGDQEMLF